MKFGVLRVNTAPSMERDASDTVPGDIPNALLKSVDALFCYHSIALFRFLPSIAKCLYSPAYFLYNRYYTIDCCVMAPSYAAGTDLSILLLLSLEYCIFLPFSLGTTVELQQKFYETITSTSYQGRRAIL